MQVTAANWPFDVFVVIDVPSTLMSQVMVVPASPSWPDRLRMLVLNAPSGTITVFAHGREASFACASETSAPLTLTYEIDVDEDPSLVIV